jgi:hypothetical protein
MVKKIVSLYLAAALVCPGAALATGAEGESSTEEAYDVTPIKAGEAAPFDGILMTYEAASKIAVDKKFEDAECELRISYELHMQGERMQLQLDYKDIEIQSWKDRYESMMILKAAENDRLEKLILKQNPTKEPWLVALGFGIGTLSSLGIFALSTEIVKSE